MAFPIVGRKVGLYDASSSPAVLVAGVTSKSCSINNETIDITSDDSTGFRTLLADPGIRSIDISVEGVAKNTDFIVAATGNGTALLKSYELRFQGIGVIAGDFFLSGVEIGAPHNEAVTFSGTLASSGTFSFTPGA